ncbi:MAG: hypothetical protein KDE15_00345 [Erythrobacter sp.]|nr:hypothetical protein [Erythrobacter sp.]
MTSNPDILDDAPPSQLRYWGHILGWSVLLTFALMGLIVPAIAAAHLASGQGSSDDWWMIGIGLPLAAILAVPLKRWMPDFTQGEPDTPRGRKMRSVVGMLVVLGVLVAAPLIIADSATGQSLTLFGNGPVPALAAGAMIAIWGLAVPVMMVISRRTSDEVARGAAEFGALVGFQTFGWLAPIWWMGWRGGLLPEPQVMILFAITMIVATLANQWKRVHG